MRLMGKLTTGAGVLALSTGFAAAAPAVVGNDLNLRAGPGTEYPVVAAMPAGAAVNVMGCEASWCRVAYNGTVGWASRAYIGGGGGVAAAPAYRGYSEGYASGGYAPAYGHDEDSYAYGSYSPGYTYGYYGGPAYGQSYSYPEGARSFGGERRFGEEGGIRGERRFSEEGALRGERRVGEETTMRGQRRVGEQTTIRSERRSGERGAVRAQGLNDDANVRSGQSAPEIQGANPMLNSKGSPAAGASSNPRAEMRGSASERRGAANVSGGANARATTGAAAGAGSGDADNGPNFLGPKAKDNHP
jgi:uncharacterized protein YraI